MNDVLELRQGASTELNGCDVGVMRIWEDDYALPDGQRARGMTARLAIHPPDRFVVVGQGSIFEVGTERYEVLSVVDAPGRGALRIRALERKRLPAKLDPAAFARALEETRRKEREAGGRFPGGKPFPIPDTDDDS